MCYTRQLGGAFHEHAVAMVPRLIPCKLCAMHYSCLHGNCELGCLASPCHARGETSCLSCGLAGPCCKIKRHPLIPIEQWQIRR